MKRVMVRGFWVWCGVVILASCVPDAAPPPVDWVTRLTPVERAACGVKGGVVQLGALGSREFCRMLPTDIGKACGKASDCQEICGAETRTCQAEDMNATPRLDEAGQVVAGAIQ